MTIRDIYQGYGLLLFVWFRHLQRSPKYSQNAGRDRVDDHVSKVYLGLLRGEGGKADILYTWPD